MKKLQRIPKGPAEIVEIFNAVRELIKIFNSSTDDRLKVEICRIILNYSVAISKDE